VRTMTRTWSEVAAPLGVSVSYATCFAVEDAARAFDALGDPDTGAAFLTFDAMNVAAVPARIMKDVNALAIRRKVAAVGDPRAGALMSYQMTFTEPMRRLAVIVDKVLRGGKPSEIPFELPDRTDFTLNRATAVAIGAVLTPDVLLRATEVIR